MFILVVLTGILMALLGIFKQVTKVTMGHQLVNVPGYVIVCLGVLIIVMGIIVS